MSILEKLSGYKTYTVVLVAIAYAFLGVYGHYIDVQTAINIVLASLGAAGLRSAIN